ncbi:MAG TPA: D-arabinono-1,4-lactone oxidase, partial [Longimicrobiaceae bacterium]|nr:D-arabinono-1,4-lactone oxidase [Longimicrobiaceae bacterium]
IELVKRARERGGTLRVIGSGHSSSEILPTEGTIVRLHRLAGLVDHDREACTATLRAGTKLEDVGPELLDVDLAFPNFGDVSSQRVAGAIATGTHGTGIHYHNLSNFLIGGRLVTGTGEVLEFSKEDTDLLKALRVAVGTLGVFTEMKLRLLPAYKLQRREFCTDYASCMEHMDELAAENMHFDFYWYPRSDEVKLRLLNPPTGGTRDLPYAAMIEDRVGWAHEIIPKHTGIRRHFDECEYHFERKAAVACFEEVRKRILEKWRAVAGWRLLYRFAASDDSYLSPCYGRETVTISVHQSAPLGFWPYFEAMEEIYADYGGRPHWGKKHSLRGEQIRKLYPEFHQFAEVRQRLDPDGIFLNGYFRELFGLDEGGR